MILAVVKNNKINKISISDNVDGNYILKDYRNNIVGNIYASDGKWLFNENDGYLLENKTDEQFIVTDKQEIILKEVEKNSYVYIYAYNTGTEFLELKIKSNNFTIGSSGDINYNSNLVKGTHAKVSKVNNIWYVESVDNSNLYVNDRLVRRKKIEYGDIIFIYGLEVILISDFLIIQNFNKNCNVTYSNSVFEKHTQMPQQLNDNLLEIESDYETYTDDEQFMRSPRFRSKIKHMDVTITPPEAKQKDQTKPAILTIGPRLTMILTSMVSLITICNNIATGKATFESSILSIIVMIVTLISSFLWPALTRKWDKHTKKRDEIKRIKSYRKYLKRKDKEISNICELQKQILLENNLSLNDCQLIIHNTKRNLWERIITDDDFLQIRVGIGKVKPDITVSWEEEDFSIDDDVMLDEMKDMLKKYEYLDNMPLNISLVNNNITAVIGNYALLHSFMQSILLQIMTQHIYNELKIVVFTDENKVDDWNYLKFLPHVWDNQHERRFIAATTEEKKQLSSYLENIFFERGASEDKEDYKKFNSYFLIIVDNINESRELGIINCILEMQGNSGFSLLIKNDRIANLPRQCTTFINVTEDVSGIFETELDEDNQKQFKADFNTSVNIEDCVQKLANIYVNVPREKYELPKSIGFMEMYEVGNVNQFNSSVRWKVNNPVNSLAAPIGIDQNGNTFYMDIHEKAYGPHGLVAGTTGSGKSEWLITYILSMAVNYSPLELQFVLIDYKGGGLAESFTNQETGMELPHLVGTITNLDKSEIRRSLASLEAESKRRQRMFNQARDKLDDSSMDIYKYQQYFRKGLVDEPLSHLIIISDEFAELKSQEPEFLDSLVSIARIGRSLGIHLILATQKPSGVVTDQIWANSRFKVCLRVQEKSDSKEMIETNDAAFLKQTGAFYLEVGNNEIYTLGQSAYAGLKYQPTNILKKKIDNSINELSRNGEIVNTYEIIEERKTNDNVHGEELLNIIKYLDDLADKQTMNPRKLWLNAIPGVIFVENLKKKYNYNRIPFKPTFIIGEYDNPQKQQQLDLKLDLTESNVFITGVAGSGKEMLIQTIIYSSMVAYTPQELNYYICDFGAETLTIFEGAPHVGGVVLMSDELKLNNLIKLIKREYSYRRTKYREFGGNYDSYNKYSGKKDPIMAIIINGYEFIKDELLDIRDLLEKIMMDSYKYGITFIISSVDKNALKYKVYETFTSVFALHMNDDSSYVEVFGKKGRSAVPKDIKGRGIFALGDFAYEFQTATIVEEEQFQTQIKGLCNKLSQYYKSAALPIPMIPNPITIDNVNVNKVSANSVMIGYSENTLLPKSIDLESNIYTMITGNKKNVYVDYMSILLKEVDMIKESNIYLLDVVGNHSNTKFNNINYIDRNNCKNKFMEFIELVNTEYEKFSNDNNYVVSKIYLVIDVISVLINQLSEDEKTMFSKALDKAEKIKMLYILYGDLTSEIKTISKNINKMLSNNIGLLLENTFSMQTLIEVGKYDIRKSMLEDNEAYLSIKGKSTLVQIFRSEKVGSDNNEI